MNQRAQGSAIKIMTKDQLSIPNTWYQLWEIHEIIHSSFSLQVYTNLVWLNPVVLEINKTHCTEGVVNCFGQRLKFFVARTWRIFVLQAQTTEINQRNVGRGTILIRHFQLFFPCKWCRICCCDIGWELSLGRSKPWGSIAMFVIIRDLKHQDGRRGRRRLLEGRD